jgi:hypothetical protein
MTTYYPYSELVIGEIVELYTNFEEKTVRVTAIDEKNNQIEAYTVEDEPIFTALTYVYSSLAYGPHWRISENFDHYLPMLKSDEITWEEYTDIGNRLRGWGKYHK